MLGQLNLFSSPISVEAFQGIFCSFASIRVRTHFLLLMVMI